MTEKLTSHDCCSAIGLGDRHYPLRCPHSHHQGKPVKAITLKSLLLPTALEKCLSFKKTRRTMFQFVTVLAGHAN